MGESVGTAVSGATPAHVRDLLQHNGCAATHFLSVLTEDKLKAVGRLYERERLMLAVGRTRNYSIPRPDGGSRVGKALEVAFLVPEHFVERDTEHPGDLERHFERG